jgi:hypothetical protein
MSLFRSVVLALVITAPAYAGTLAPVPLTGNELKALCTIDVSTMQICVGYVAGVSDDLEITSQSAVQTMGADAGALFAPCPGKQMAELVASTLKELDGLPKAALNDPALMAVRFALHPLPLGCGDSGPSSPEASIFADCDRLKLFCTGNDRNERLQCQGYIRAVADAMLRVLNDARVRLSKSCTPTWQTPDQAVGATIVYLNAHPEHGKVSAPTLIQAALLPPACPLAPVSTPPASSR